MGRFVYSCTTNLKGSLALGCGLFLLSVLISRYAAILLADNRKLNPLLLGLVIPIVTVVPLSRVGYRLGYLRNLESEMCGVGFAVDLIFAGGLLWGAIVGIWRRNLPAP